MILLSYFYFFFLGRLIYPYFFEKNENQNLNYLAIGLGAWGILLTLAYRFGLSVPTATALGWGSVFILSIFLKRGKIGFASILIPFILLSLPAWVGGFNFQVFQGNQWDTFGYLQSAHVFLHESFQFVAELESADFIKNPLYSIASINLESRPTAHLIYASTQWLNPERLPFEHYHFLVLCFVAATLSGTFFLQNFYSRGKAFALGLAFVMGFFGQYIFDINAWSNIVGLGLLFILIGRVFHLIENGIKKIDWGFCLAVTALCFIYPEILAFFFPACLFLLIRSLYFKKISPPELSKILLCIGLGIMPCFLFYQGTIGFVIHQLFYATTENVNHWTYFQKYLFGQGDLGIQLKSAADNLLKEMGGDKGAAVSSVNWIAFAKSFFLSAEGLPLLFVLMSNFLAGFLGLYFLTPTAGTSLITQLIWSLGLFTFCSGLLFFFFRDFLRTHRRIFFYFVLALLGTSCLFLVKKEFWGFGKGLTFLSPFLFWAFFLESKRKITLLYLGLHFAFGFYRIFAASNSYGIHYNYPPYPSVHNAAREAKLSYNWKLPEIDESCERVAIEVDDIWIRTFLTNVLYAKKIPFYLPYDITSFYRQGKVLGRQTFQRTDCRLRLIQRQLVFEKI